MIIAAVRRSLAENRVPARMMIGLSGGADSVALTLALSALRQEQGLELSAVYVHHGLRKAADEEAEFCRSLCEGLNIRYMLRRVQVSGCGSPEAAARAARYAAFRDAMSEAGAETLALAHHRDDQAETVLLHLLYGAGADGLSGMAEYRPPVWRPLLSLSRDDLRSALREAGQEWREDASNADTRFTRNALRARVMPQICAVFPQAPAAIARAAGLMRDENDYLNQLAAQWITSHTGRGRQAFLLSAPLSAQHAALQRRILRAYAAERGVSLDAAQTERLRMLLAAPPGTYENLPGSWRALRTRERVHLLPPEKAEPPIPDQSDLRISPFKGEDRGDGKLRQAFPQAMLRETKLRTRRPGDYIHPFGMQGKMKLKDYMIARRVDQPFREDWPLLCRASEVLWVIGIGASQAAQISSDAEDAVMLEYTGSLPDHIEGGHTNAEGI